MRNSARASHSQMGRAMPLNLSVPRMEQLSPEHRIFWTHKNRKSAEERNSAVTTFKRPCLRRYLEFRGCSYPGLEYEYYAPAPSIGPHPAHLWVLCDPLFELVTYTNAVEAWLVHLGLKYFNNQLTTIIYIDRSS